MWLLTVRRQSIFMAAMFSIAVVVLNLLTFRYLVTNDIEHTDLSVLQGKCIAIDPGHGGIDEGASWHGNQEKAINLAIAAELAAVLKTNGANVVLTRDSDVDYYTRGKGGKRNDLLKRVEAINQSGANVYVSIHCNAIKGARWSGAQVFYNPKLEENKVLAEIMQQALKSYPPGNKRQAKQDSGLLLLKSVNMPGVLVEAGFISNKEEAVKLADSAYQQALALSIAKGLAYHFNHNAGR